MQPELIESLNQQMSARSLTGRLALIKKHFPNVVFTTSLGPEDQVITHMLATSAIDISIATLNTGRLFPQSLDLLAQTRTRYDISIKEFHPRETDLKAYLDEYGLNGFYDSVEARRACCHSRKLVPLAQALKGRTAWITGLRRAQSHNRSHVPFVEWSEEYQLAKFNPIADWTNDDLTSAIRFHQVPVNPLHEKGYASIGCEPCTRAIKPGEPERAGRWWWEQDQTRECGLHVASGQ